MEPSYQKGTKIESEGNQHVSWRIGGFRRKTGNKYDKKMKGERHMKCLRCGRDYAERPAISRRDRSEIVWNAES